jgi:hypothetical protein
VAMHNGALDMKWNLGFSSLIFLILSIHNAHDFQSRYTRVESYEIRPDIVATPKYDENGSLCEIAIEKRHVQGEIVDLGATIPRERLLEILDELAPPTERGKSTNIFSKFDYEIINGSFAVTVLDYEKVSAKIFRVKSDSGDTAAIVTWKNACVSHETR